MKSEKIALSIIVLAVLATALAVLLSASAYDHGQTYNANSTYFVPEIMSTSGYGDDTTVHIWTNTTIGIGGGQTVFNYDPACANVTSFTFDTSNWDSGPPGTVAYLENGRVRIIFTTFQSGGRGPGPVHLGYFTIECNDTSSCCMSNVTWNLTYPGLAARLDDDSGAAMSPVNWADGVFTCGSPINVTKTVKDPTTGQWVPSYTFPMGTTNPGVNVTFNVTVHAECCNLTDITVTDVLDSGLAYANSATVNGVPCEPQVSGQTLTWSYNTGACTNNFTDLDICNEIHIEFNATVTSYGEHNNSVTATGWCNESVLPVSVSDNDDASVSLPSPARIEVNKTIQDPITGGWVKVLGPRVIDEVDIGNPASEAGHSLQGWGPALNNSHTHINYGNMDGGGDLRVAWAPGNGTNNPTGCPGVPPVPTYCGNTLYAGCGDDGNVSSASFEMNNSGHAKQLQLRVLDGIGDDSFDVYVNGILAYSYAWSGNTNEFWVTHNVTIPASERNVNPLVITVDATGPAWSGLYSWGQLAVNWSKLYTWPQICDTYRIKCTVHNAGSTGLNLEDIRVWDIMSDSLEYVNNATMKTPDGITRSIEPPTYLSPDKTKINWTVNDYLQSNLTLQPCQSIEIQFDMHVVNYGNDSNMQCAKGWYAGEGKWISDCDQAWINTPKPDLTVSDITINWDASSVKNKAIGPLPPGTKTQCNNLSADITELNGVDVKFPFNVKFEVNGLELGCSPAQIPADMSASSTVTVYCNCSFYPIAGLKYNISVIADSAGAIIETNEGNNRSWRNVTAEWNGYKGDGWQDGRNLTNVQCDTGTINLTYSVGDSCYAGYGGCVNATWDETTEYEVTWTADEFNIPATETCIKKAWLYVYYTYDKYGVMPHNVNMTFNGHDRVLVRNYSDGKGLGSATRDGMLMYDVTEKFIATANNTAILTKPAPSTYIPIKGMLLMVVYNHSSEPQRIICIDEGFDKLYARDSYAISSEEATTYATFPGCEPITTAIGKATLIAVAPNGGYNEDWSCKCPECNKLSFNDGEWYGAWADYEKDSRMGIAKVDVREYLKNDSNIVSFQSHKPTQAQCPTCYDKGDHMDASNAFLVLEVGNVEMAIEAPDECVGQGTQFDVDITVDPKGTSVFGVEYEIDYNETVLHAEWQNEGNFLNQDGASTTVYENGIDHLNGRLTFAVSRTGTTTGVTTPGVLATIRFTALDQGADTTLTFTDWKVTNSDAFEVDAITFSDNVQVCDNAAPVAAGESKFTYNNAGYHSKTKFDGSNSYDPDPDGSISHYIWFFGDGNEGYGETPVHEYESFKWNTTIGNYDPFEVALTVHDDGTPILDNTTTFPVDVYMAGDASGDGEVDIVDGSIVGLEFWSQCSVDSWSTDRGDKADLNNDCWVDIEDASVVGITFWNTAW